MKRTTVAMFVAVMLGVVPTGSPSQSDDVASRVDALLEQMTLAEKIGQLNQYSNTFDITGPPAEDHAGRERLKAIRNGLVGSMLNIAGVEETRIAQQHAVENSRLGIPMIFALDVIHGYRTMFPIPLGEAASWDLEAIERSARIAATGDVADLERAAAEKAVGYATDPAYADKIRRILNGPVLESALAPLKNSPPPPISTHGTGGSAAERPTAARVEA